MMPKAASLLLQLHAAAALSWSKTDWRTMFRTASECPRRTPLDVVHGAIPAALRGTVPRGERMLLCLLQILDRRVLPDISVDDVFLSHLDMGRLVGQSGWGHLSQISTSSTVVAAALAAHLSTRG